jgi:hypothetical protein
MVPSLYFACGIFFIVLLAFVLDNGSGAVGRVGEKQLPHSSILLRSLLTHGRAYDGGRGKNAWDRVPKSYFSHFYVVSSGIAAYQISNIESYNLKVKRGVKCYFYYLH